jgi:hypothetical protein
VICSGEETNIALSTTTSGTETVTYSWTAVESQATTDGEIDGFSDHTAKTLSEIKQTLTNTGTRPGKVKYTVIPHIGNCPGTALEIEITVNPVAQVNNVTDQTRCAGQNTDLITFGTANSGGITTYTWTNDNIAIGLAAASAGNVTEIPSFKALNPTHEPITATITVTPTFTNDGVACSGPDEIFTITVNPTPVIVDKAPPSICSGTAFTVNPANGVGGDIVPAGTTYTWTIKSADPGISGATPSNAAGVTSISQTLSNSSNIVQKVVYTVIPKSGDDGDCVGEDFDIEVTVNPVAVVTAAPNPEVICTGATTSINLTPASTGTVAMTYSWTASVTTGASASITGFSNQTTPSSLNKILHTLVNTGTSPGVVTYEVTPHFGSCAGTKVFIPVTVNPLGQVDQENDLVICNGGTTQIVEFTTINTVGTTTYAWQMNTDIGAGTSGTGNIPAFTAVNNTLTAIVATVTVVPTFSYQGITCLAQVPSVV